MFHCSIQLEPSVFEHLITPDMISEIKNMNYLENSKYQNLNIVDTLRFFISRYINQLQNFLIISEESVIADIGAGFAWFPIAFALTTKAKKSANDADKDRLFVGKKIATIPGINKRIEWNLGILGNWKITDKSVNVVFCIEVLEHVPKSKDAVKDLCRISRSFIVLKTPKLWFPIIAHDTGHFFCHWLPVSWRKIYAKIAKRNVRENPNLFWSPVSLKSQMSGYKRISKWLHYALNKNYLDTILFYLPYGKGGYVKSISYQKKSFIQSFPNAGNLNIVLDLLWREYIKNPLRNKSFGSCKTIG